MGGLLTAEIAAGSRSSAEVEEVSGWSGANFNEHDYRTSRELHR
jgi:hypothetical protein